MPPPTLKPIEPKTERWEPMRDPNDIIVPGLNTNAPPYDQIEQIEQLITIKLQNIDANFSKMQQIMANRILPAVKRYAVSTEPVREASKFWVTFYEQAARVHVPTFEDYSEIQDQDVQPSASDSEAGSMTQSDTSTSEEVTTPTRSHQSYQSEGTSSEVSFAPGQAAISSTPATTSRYRSMHQNDSFASQGSDPTPSWSASLESPLVKLSHEVQSLSLDEQLQERSAADSSLYDMSQDITQRAIPVEETSQQSRSMRRVSDAGKGKGREPLLQNVLLRNASTADPSSPRRHAVSPLKFKAKTPILKKMNPYLPAGSKPTDWKGVVNLTDPVTKTPQQGLPESFYKELIMNSARTARPSTPDRDDDSFDLEAGMSPPVTFGFARLPKLGRTPGKEAAGRITKDLLNAERVPAGTSKDAAGRGRKIAGTESSMSTISTPPSLSRYTHASESNASAVEASLDSIMRRVGLDIPGYTARYSLAGPAALDAPQPGPSGLARRPAAEPSPTPTEEPFTPPPAAMQYFLDNDDSVDYVDQQVTQEEYVDQDSSSDSLDYEVNNTQNPSAAFLQASERASYDDDDSFASDASDEPPDESDAPIHPFVRAQMGVEDAYEDSFEDSMDAGEPEEETVFGVPPAQRLRLQNQQSRQDLRMLGQGLLEDTIGIGTQMAEAGKVDETPTPFGR